MKEYQNTNQNFAKDYAPNWSKEVFAIKKVKNTLSWTYVINDLSSEEFSETFYEKELQKTNQKEFRIEKVIKKWKPTICHMERLW